MANRVPDPIEVLLVEDSPSDIRLTEEALTQGKIANRLHVVRDGMAAIQYLRREPPHAEAVRPDLILLDLNLPRLDGRGVLSEIKADPSLQEIPVVVLTTSAAQQDIIESYKLQANCYVTKPVGLSQFLDVIQSIEHFWLTVVRLPRTD